jgi:hypothetical protein
MGIPFLRLHETLKLHLSWSSKLKKPANPPGSTFPASKQALFFCLGVLVECLLPHKVKHFFYICKHFAKIFLQKIKLSSMPLIVSHFFYLEVAVIRPVNVLRYLLSVYQLVPFTRFAQVSTPLAMEVDVFGIRKFGDVVTARD